MSSYLEATCEAGVVQHGTVIVEDAVILSQGTRASEGALIMDQGRHVYLTSNAEDIADLIDTLGQLVQKIIQIATTLDAGLVSPGTASANILLLTQMNTELSLMKENLK